MKSLFRKNKKLLKELLKDQKQGEKLDLSEEVKKMKELKALLNK